MRDELVIRGEANAQERKRVRGQRAKGLIEPSKQRDSEVESREGDMSDDADQTQGYAFHFL